MSYTGYGAGVSLDPSELNLWRLIRVNGNNTVEAISVHVSSRPVYFNGATGYLNYIGALNLAAAVHTNEQYVLNTKHFGYLNQVEFCEGPITGLLSFSCDDGLYTDELDLVKAMFGTLKGTTPSGVETSYFLSGRNRSGSNAVYSHYLRTIDKSGNKSSVDVYSIDAYASSGSGTSRSASIRPIVTFKSSVRVTSGTGNDNSPYILGGS